MMLTAAASRNMQRINKQKREKEQAKKKAGSEKSKYNPYNYRNYYATRKTNNEIDNYAIENQDAPIAPINEFFNDNLCLPNQQSNQPDKNSINPNDQKILKSENDPIVSNNIIVELKDEKENKNDPNLNNNNNQKVLKKKNNCCCHIY